jgi:flavin-dependent dehydrogenase
MYEASPAVACWYFSYWGDVPDIEGLEIYRRQRSVIFAFPTSHGLFAIFIGWPIEEFHAVRSNIEKHFMAVIGRVPALAERVRSGRRVERFYGTANVPNFLRKAHGPGWALVGDAGCHKDPYLALGVCDALRDAEFLVDAIDEGLSGRRPLDEALADYERRRNEATLADYHENLQQARLQPLPVEVLQLRAALRSDPEATNQFFMAREGMIPRETFFNSENLQRIRAKAQAKT